MLKNICLVLALVISVSCAKKSSSGEDVFKTLSGERTTPSKVVIEDIPTVEEDLLSPTTLADIPPGEEEVYELAVKKAESSYEGGRLLRDISYLEKNIHEYNSKVDGFESMTALEKGLSKEAFLYSLLLKFENRRTMALKYYSDLSSDIELRRIAAFVYLENRYEY